MIENPSQNEIPESDKKDAVGAAIISVFIPGAGQIYTGQVWKGLTILFFFGVLALGAIYSSAGVAGMVGLLLLLMWLLNISDAYRSAKAVNQGQEPEF